MKNMIKLLFPLFAFLLIFMGRAKAAEHVLTSPDKEISLEVFQSDEGSWCYRLSAYDSLLIDKSLLGFRDSLGNQLFTAQQLRLVSVERDRHDGVWKPVWGKRSRVKDCYNELSLLFSYADAKRTIGCRSGLTMTVWHSAISFPRIRRWPSTQ